MEDYSRAEHEKAGYSFVWTPHIAKSTLFEISGHLSWYADGMYPPMEMEGATYYPKPMNCPVHMLIYRSQQRSYKELPLRLFEFGTVYRYERTGVLHGLTRVRGITQDDAHIFCTPDQLADELASLLKFVLRLLRTFGLSDFEAELSTRPEKYVGELEEWEEATEALRYALEVEGLPYTVAEGEGAFYGPKIDVHVRDAIGRRWQMSTLQVDFQFPTRFDLEYIGPDNQRHRPRVSTARCSARSSASSRSCSSTTRARCRCGCRRCRCDSSASVLTTTRTPTASPTASGPRASAPTTSKPTNHSAHASARPSSRRSRTCSWSVTTTCETAPSA